MTDDNSDPASADTWYGRVRRLLTGEPASRDDLLELLREPHWAEVLDADELAMLEGVLGVAESQVRDVMVPRSQMVVLELDAEREKLLDVIINSGHSRFPVIGRDREEVVGILLAKDILRYFVETPGDTLDLSRWLRPPTFIPESKRLSTLLKEFRVSRNHIAIVVDEYGGVAGLLTIEDVLEEIVGEIDDEFDHEVAQAIQPQPSGTYHVRAITRIDDFNDFFQSAISDEHFDTVGGLVMYELGHLPRRGESLVFGSFRFHVLQADRRRVQLIEVTQAGEASPADHVPRG